MIGAIVAEAGKTQTRAEPITRAQPVKGQKISGKSRGFMAFKTLHKKNGT